MTGVQFLDLLRRSQLTDEDRVRGILNLFDDAEQLATTMVKEGVLTEWQAEKLLAGKWKGFFLDDYTLLRHLRKTAISVEYVAEHTLMKHKVVLTIAPPRLVDNPVFLERFCREGGNGQLHRNGMTYYLVRDYREDDVGLE
jgi:serine/threonine-protein kinase